MSDNFEGRLDQSEFVLKQLDESHHLFSRPIEHITSMVLYQLLQNQIEIMKAMKERKY